MWLLYHFNWVYHKVSFSILNPWTAEDFIFCYKLSGWSAMTWRILLRVHHLMPHQSGNITSEQFYFGDSFGKWFSYRKQFDVGLLVKLPPGKLRTKLCIKQLIMVQMNLYLTILIWAQWSRSFILDIFKSYFGWWNNKNVDPLNEGLVLGKVIHQRSFYFTWILI